ncbi:hypothetical protein SAMN04488103_1164 [Gemmobacter aquatilis]|uniref:Uncharacterized protein n=1 Tax=Gemmobacter aquatilis TaxID=933059 RepID=A0A1H8N1G4_9RHOB|nr:hypothetical protein [Gemmobacter aquatilis]SEO23404.1 hypothetical protein SAMN04488103_1164 [Gemmobacter aquatilis]
MTDLQEISGFYLGRGVECPQLRLHDGEQISLEGGDFSTVVPGDLVTLTGNFIMVSTCMQGRAFLVAGISETAPPGN